MPVRTLGRSLAAPPQPTRLPRSTRSAAVLLCAATLTMAASACSSSSSSSASVGGAAAHHLTAYVSGDTNIQKLWEDIVVPAFQKANPGYQVKVVFSAHGTADATTLAKLQAPARGEVVRVSVGQALSYAVAPAIRAEEAASEAEAA
ncbi:hypothetical protein ACGFY9_40545 [Streptomyces sp. NPDC048504]|uniref:hypothetical protein n=1 Tax=Streptomyces sp. NPDC048504 TaxID=3365559 RepID=UPI00371C7704